MTDRVRLVPDRQAPNDGRLLGLVVILLLTGVALLARPWWGGPTMPPGVLVDVRGEVPHPGMHLVDPPTLTAAVEAAGGLSDGIREMPLQDGDAIEVYAHGARLVPHGNPALVAIPVDVNRVDADALAALPGIRVETANAIVSRRRVVGGFRRWSDLYDVPGLGASRVRELQPLMSLSDPGPLDLNHASVEALEALPGIGQVTAERIVADRAAHGPFESVDDLARVKGIGQSTVARVAPMLVVWR